MMCSNSKPKKNLSLHDTIVAPSHSSTCLKKLSDVLKAQPSYDELCAALTEWISVPVISEASDHNSVVITPLVTRIIPAFWPLAQTDKDLHVLLVKSLASVSGLKTLLDHRQHLECLDVLQAVLQSDELKPWHAYNALFNGAKEDARLNQRATERWALYVKFLAGGQILSLVSETAANATNKSTSGSNTPGFWLHDLKAFTKYLAAGVIHAIHQQITYDDQQRLCLGIFVTRSMSLGDSFTLVSTILSSLITRESALATLAAIIDSCSMSVKERFVVDMLRYLQTEYLFHPASRLSLQGFQGDADRVGAVALVLAVFTRGNLLSCFENALAKGSSSYNLAMRRSLIISLPTDSHVRLVQTCMAQWADNGYVKRVSTSEQEVLTETILLLAAYVLVQELAVISKSKAFVDGISYHLESTSDRVRFLGMILGETISAQLIVDEKKRLTFGVPDTQTSEARWWRSLIEIEDRQTSLDHLRAGLVENPEVSVRSSATQTHELQISEILEDDLIESSDDEEFTPMRVPDSDDEDSDEDPSMVDREKLRPPVYVRDLIKMLNNHESYKHVSMALRIAPSLIRRKIGFGTEVEDYAINLAQLFAGMRDNFDMDDFQQLRQEALKALVIVCPQLVCPYLVETFFTGDYSLQQRVIILSAIGLGSRELAGAVEAAPQFQNLTISKPLPTALKQEFESVTNIATTIQHELLTPLAIEAVDMLSGPAALKVQTTTRRMQRSKPETANNRLTPIAAEYILFPLLGRFQLHGAKMIDRDASTFYEANLLAYYLRTISLIFQVSSKSPAFSRLTSEFWELLLSLRSQTDHQVLSALLFSLLIIIENNNERRLATDHAHQLIQTREWCEGIFREVAEEKVQQVAAGVLLKIGEIVERHQVLMMTSGQSMGSLGGGRFGIAGLT